MNTKTLENKSGTIILPCRCPNVYQDIYYGHGMRVYNLKAKKETGKAIAGATCLAAILDKDYVSAILFGLFLLFVVGVILLAISRLLS